MISVERRMSSEEFLDGDEALVLGQFLHDVDGDVDAVGDAVGIDHHRQVAGGSNGLERGHRFLRIGVVDRARHDHQAVGAGRSGAPGDFGGLTGAGLVDCQQHRLAVGRALRGLQYGQLLLCREHRPFAERSADDDAVAACFHLKGKAALHLGVVEGVIFGELGCDGWEDSGPHNGLSI